MPPRLILESGTHQLYADRVSAERFHTADDKKQGNFTLHHIIPYRYPFFVGFVFDQLISRGHFNNLQAADKSDMRSLAHDLKFIGNSLLPAACKLHGDEILDPTKGPLGHKFAWMGVNLFIGPSGTWRLDDPKSSEETQRPQSFDVERWAAVHALKTFVDAFAEFDDNAHTVTTVKLDSESAGFLTGLLARLNALRSCGKDAHPFTYDDWVILDSDNIAFGMARRGMDKAKGDDGKVKSSQAKQLLDQLDRTGQVDLYRPVAHREVSFAGVDAQEGWKVFWRLRKDAEPIPELKYKANFQVQ